MVIESLAMRCSRCAKEIPDGSRFCGLCGGKQTVMSQTLVGTAERFGRAQTLFGGPVRGEVIGGGRRFAALSAAPQPSSPPPPSSPPAAADTPAASPADTLAEGVPSAAMAALLTARKAPTPSNLNSTLLGTPAITRGQLKAERTSSEHDGRATEKDIPALVQASASTEAAAIETSPADTAKDAPAAVRSDDLTAGSAEPKAAKPAAPDLSTVDPPGESADPVPSDLVATQPATPAVKAIRASEPSVPPPKRIPASSVPVRPVRVERPAEPSVIVDSEFGREVQRAESLPPKASAPSDPPAAAVEEPPKGKKPGFSETAWFLDALDADALSRAEDEDLRDKQVRMAQSMPGLDPDARRQFSLRTQDQPARPIKRDDDPARTLPDRSQERPDSPRRNDAVIGLVVVVLVALAVVGWVLYGR